jgi:hypothetical protein
VDKENIVYTHIGAYSVIKNKIIYRKMDVTEAHVKKNKPD